MLVAAEHHKHQQPDIRVRCRTCKSVEPSSSAKITFRQLATVVPPQSKPEPLISFESHVISHIAAGEKVRWLDVVRHGEELKK